MNVPYKDNLIFSNQSIQEALQKLNNVPQNLTLFVINNTEQLIGTLTDGDVRRALLQGKTLTTSVSEAMSRSFHFLKHGEASLDKVEQAYAKAIKLLPILDDDGKIVRVVSLNQKRSILPLDAVIMAGGKGTRLRPLTLNTPKPLLKVGDKPIIEYNIDRLQLYGVYNMYISVHYLGEQIEDYFKDGRDRGIRIQYIHEKKPSGTMGAAALVPDYEHDHILIMNSDLLTNIDFKDFYTDFLKKDADMSVATIPYKVNIPYGVVETQDERIKTLKEKPVYTYYSNAGIYIIKRELLKSIPPEKFFDATDMLDMLIRKDKHVTNYPILGYWLDIGKPEDFERAQQDIHHIQF